MRLVAKAADHVKSHPAYIAARDKRVHESLQKDEL